MKFVLLVFFSCCAIGFGQDEGEEKKSSIRILPVGSMPVFKLPPINRRLGGGHGHLEALPFSIPPSTVWLKGEGEKVSEIDLRLKTLSERVTFSGEEVELLIKEGKRRDGDLKVWATIKVPNKGDYLLVLAKSLKGDKSDWEKVRTFLLNDDSKEFPAGKVRFLNTCQEVAAARVSKSGRVPPNERDKGKAFTIQPNGQVIRAIPDRPSSVVIARGDKDGTWKRIYANGLDLEEGERSSFVIYHGNGTKIRAHYFKENILRKP